MFRLKGDRMGWAATHGSVLCADTRAPLLPSTVGRKEQNGECCGLPTKALLFEGPLWFWFHVSYWKRMDSVEVGVLLWWMESYFFPSQLVVIIPCIFRSSVEILFASLRTTWCAGYLWDCRECLLCLACPFPNSAHAQKPIWKRLCILIDNRNFCFEFWQRVYAPQNAFQLTLISFAWLNSGSALLHYKRLAELQMCFNAGEKNTSKSSCCVWLNCSKIKNFNSSSSFYPFKLSPRRYEMRKLQAPEESGCGWWQREMLSFKK